MATCAPRPRRSSGCPRCAAPITRPRSRAPSASSASSRVASPTPGPRRARDRRFGAPTDDAAPAAWWSLPNDSLVAALTHDAVLQWLCGEQAAADDSAGQPAGRTTALRDRSVQHRVHDLVPRLDGQPRRPLRRGAALHERVIGIGEEYGLLFWTATGTCHWAISRGHLGEPEQAIEILEPAIEQWRALGAETFVPCFRTHLAEIRLGLQQYDRALADVERAIEQANRTGEEWFAAESHRVRGTILHRLHPDDLARALDAVDTAQRLAAPQGALMFELRGCSTRSSWSRRSIGNSARGAPRGGRTAPRGCRRPRRRAREGAARGRRLTARRGAQSAGARRRPIRVETITATNSAAPLTHVADPALDAREREAVDREREEEDRDQRADHVEAAGADRRRTEEDRRQGLETVAHGADLRAGAAVAGDEEHAGERRRAFPR